MDAIKLTAILTRAAVVMVFWFVMIFSLIFEQSITMMVILMDFVKALLVAGVSWIFLSVIIDTLVKSIVASAKQSKAERFDGGISYHFIEPSEEEKAWQGEHEDELKEGEEPKGK